MLIGQLFCRKLSGMTRPDPRRFACLLLAVAGCATQKPFPPPPQLLLQTVRLVGSPLATTEKPAPFDASAAVGIRVTWLALPGFPDDGLIPLDAAASLTAAPLGDGAVLSAGRFSREARFGGGMAAIRWAGQLPSDTDHLGQQTAFVAPGTTVRFNAELEQTDQLASIAIYRDAAPARPVAQPASMPATTQATITPAALPAIDASFAISLGLPSTLRPGAAAAGSETTFVYHQSLSTDTPYVVLLPPRAKQTQKNVAAFIEVLPAEADEAERAAWEKEAKQTSPTANPLRQPTRQLALQRALEALAVEKDPRAALIYLSSSTEARITADVALVADDVLLSKMRDAVKAADTQSAETIGWVLEKTTLLTLADAAGKAPLPPEMQAVLAVHAGEVGRHPDQIAEIANAVGSINSLHERLIGENFIALEDNSASARVRAFDWLKTQGKAPADFDPLGSPRARRAAINRAISSPGGTP